MQHAGGNTRLRDYYDLWIFCTKCPVDDDKVLQAFADSWHLYDADTVPLMAEIENYCTDFADRNSAVWDGLRSAWAIPVPDLATVITTIRERLGPIVDRAATPTFGVAA